jgi:UDP-N-acetylmuramoylalanine--D-glutamate ligase
MILLPFASGKTYGVLGLGKSGRATVASLLKSGADVVAWDDGETSREAALKEFPSLRIAPVEAWHYASLAALVVSPGIFLSHPAVVAAEKAGVEILGDIELLYRALPNARYVTITGTNGKSTTTTLIAHILNACGKRVEVGGNLGTPALALAPLDADGIYVLELSSYQLDLVRTTKFDVAVLLNISPDHLDHHGSMENYIAAKMHIFDRMDAQGLAIIGIDDGVCERIFRQKVAESGVGVFSISAVNKTARVYTYQPWLNRRRKLRLNYGHESGTGDISAIKSLQGQHNWQNAAAAYAACYACGCWNDDIIAAMQTYPGLAHRMEWLGEIAGVQYVNDSKATNADAAEKALLTYDHVYWIIGGVSKEGGIEPLTKYFPKIRHAYLIGEAAADFAKTLEGKVAYTHCGTLEKAFAAATGDARRDKVNGAAVLLSPACASFDQYPNFEVRGQAFVKLFESLKAGGTHAATA